MRDSLSRFAPLKIWTRGQNLDKIGITVYYTEGMMSLAEDAKVYGRVCVRFLAKSQNQDRAFFSKQSCGNRERGDESGD